MALSFVETLSLLHCNLVCSVIVCSSSHLCLVQWPPMTIIQNLWAVGDQLSIGPVERALAHAARCPCGVYPVLCAFQLEVNKPIFTCRWAHSALL